MSKPRFNWLSVSNLYAPIFLGAAWVILMPSQVFAQTPQIITPIPPTTLPQKPPTPLPSPDELLQLPRPVAPTDLQPTDTDAIAVKQFEVG